MYASTLIAVCVLAKMSYSRIIRRYHILWMTWACVFFRCLDVTFGQDEWWYGMPMAISVESQETPIPEPMLFDLVRPLGVKKGELEINTLAQFQWSARNTDPSSDPFGSGQTTRDLGGIEWAPEIEFGIADGLAVEFELPFEGSKLEAYKVAFQSTLGTAFEGSYIHGFQAIVEPTVEWREWNSTLLYLGGVRFDEQWSALFMVGGRMNLAGPKNSESFERLFNASLFREVNSHATFGLEVNNASGFNGKQQTILVPQMHYELNQNLELQSGLGLGVFESGWEQSFVMRVIWTR